MGTISPMQFIPVAEETGLIVPIGYWVLETACRQAKQWQAEGAGDLRISVNVSLRQFQEPDFAKRIAAILHATGLAPNLLDLEITESVAIENLQAILVTISAIKKLGVHFSLDDFGTGYSSLSNLADLPMDSVKIDKSFIQTMLTAPRNAAIARSIISMARSLNLEVIAEGVEESQQLEFLEAHDCDTMQGFLFSKPVDADRLAEMLGLSDNSVRVAA
jgi:EAL domain-containing protein (putative c-di-GMP-specific phosphodiesterase class I)